MRLATRTFLWSLLPFAVLLTGSFWVVQRRVLLQVRQGLERSVTQMQASMAKIRSREVERNGRVLRVVSQNPSLKAVIQLMLSDRADAQARRTVEEQLVEIAGDLGFDFLLVSDNNGLPLAAVMREQGQLRSLDPSRQQPPLQNYFTRAGRTYHVTSVPIDEASENLGTLSVGERFDLSSVPGQAVLLRNGEILESTAAGVAIADAQPGLQNCPRNAACEVQFRGETYVSRPLESEAQEGSGDGYQVRSLQSLDAATRDIQAALRHAFLLAGLGALVAAVLVSGLSSRSIIRPIARVIARLHESARTGDLPEFDSQRERIHEIRDLMASFNRAAAAIRDGRARLQKANVEFIESLASALDARDPYTAGHSRRVSQYACATAQAMALPPLEIEEIRIGALLHDIGKIGITDSVLQKPGRLTSDEDALIRQHPSIGRRILEGVNGFQPYLNVVELHHENWDGSGYPKGLYREATPRAARVVKVADAWDAMTSDRPYRQGMSRNQALATLRGAAGTQMDPAVVEVFCRLWGAEGVGVPPPVESQPAQSLIHLADAVEPAARVEIASSEQTKDA